MLIGDRFESRRVFFDFRDCSERFKTVKPTLLLASRQITDRLAQCRNLLPENLRERGLLNDPDSLEDPQSIAAVDPMMPTGVAAEDQAAVVL
jgi:hypothetical protein